MANETERRRDGDQNKWNEMLSMLAMAQRTDPRTLPGFGLGRLLRNYYLRGEEKRERLKGEEGANALSQRPTTGQQDTDAAAQARYEDSLFNGYNDRQSPSGMEMTGGQRGKGENPVPPGSASDVTVRDGLLGDGKSMYVDTNFLPANDTSRLEEAVNALGNYGVIPFNPNYRTSYPQFVNTDLLNIRR